MTKATTNVEILRQGLEKVRDAYHAMLTITPQKRDYYILVFLQTIGQKYEELLEINQACTQVLSKYPNKEFLKMEDATLLEEVYYLLRPELRRVLPSDAFEKDRLMYRLHYTLAIQPVFDELRKMALENEHQAIINQLEYSVSRTFIENANFKGPNPYYKRRYEEMGKAKSIWLDCLDRDFQSYLEYFVEQ